MAEAITEMIIPGTYIEVRAEGLIGVSGIATGNVGIVGTANRGPIGEVRVLSSFSEAKETFGSYDGWSGGSDNELTLVRALQQVFNNGGSTVYTVRVGAAAGVAEAGIELKDSTGTVATVNGVTPGSWANEITVEVKAAPSPGFVEEETHTAGAGGAVTLTHAKVASSPQNALKITKAATGRSVRLALLPGTGTPSSGQVFVDTANGNLTFPASPPSQTPAAGDTVVASYQVEATSSRDIEVVYKNLKESYRVVDAKDMVRDINSSSSLVRVTIATGADDRVPDQSAAALLTGGSDGEAATKSDYKTGLDVLDAEPVNIVVSAGQGFSNSAADLQAHVETAENNGRDRISVCGADKDDVAEVSANAGAVSDDRLILVAPGIRAQDITLGVEVDLPPAYAAAAVAGVIASLAVQVSPTNKALRVSGLTKDYSDGEVKKLLGNRVMVLQRKAGYRIVKGITTDDGPFRQVSVRRIVDYAKNGTRIGSNPYIGRLNNSRVRSALKATLNGFLSDMVLNEALTSFTLDVTATREQEIAGVAVVTMFLKPTFSIDYIKVIMNLS